MRCRSQSAQPHESPETGVHTPYLHPHGGHLCKSGQRPALVQGILSFPASIQEIGLHIDRCLDGTRHPPDDVASLLRFRNSACAVRKAILHCRPAVDSSSLLLHTGGGHAAQRERRARCGLSLMMDTLQGPCVAAHSGHCQLRARRTVRAAGHRPLAAPQGAQAPTAAAPVSTKVRSASAAMYAHMINWCIHCAQAAALDREGYTLQWTSHTYRGFGCRGHTDL